MNWYIDVIKKYAVFNGRARRTEYWMFILFNMIVSIVLTIIDAVTGLGILALIYSLAVLLPSIGVAIRRLHDTGRVGWWLLLGFIPIIGLIILLVFFIQEGTKGDNEYGPDPKALA